MSLCYWDQRFNALIPLLADLTVELSCWEDTIDATGIHPYLVWAEQ